MQIFVLDSNPRLAAQFHCDKHVVKQVCETAQILCTALHVRGETARMERIKNYTNGVWCKPTHVNHPCVKIVTESQIHFGWVSWLGYYLSREYTARYHKAHAYSQLLDDIILTSDNTQEFPIEISWPQAMPEQYRIPGDPIQAYRNYYIGEKSGFAKWKYSPTPNWYIDSLNKQKIETWKEMK